MAICQRLKSTLESEAQRLEERAFRQTEEKKELQQRLDEKIKQLQDKESEFRLLKDTMATMDEQLQVIKFQHILLSFCNIHFHY